MSLDIIISQLTLRNVILSLFAYITFRIVYQIVYYRFFHPLRGFPGPFWGSVTRLWVGWHCLRGTECEVELKLHRKYGPVIRITPNQLLISDATKLPLVYQRHADKSKHYIAGAFGKAEALFNMQDAKQHAYYRKIAAGPYSFSNLKKMEPLIDALIVEWNTKLKEKFIKTRTTFDFAPWAVFLTYDVFSEIGFGEKFGFIESETDVGGLIQGFHDGLPYFGLMARLYPFTNAIRNTWIGEKYLVARPEHQTGIGNVMRFRDKLLEQRLRDIEAGATSGRVDFLQTFIDARHSDGTPLSTEYIKAEILLVLLAGADTTGTAFQAMVYYIVTHPDVYARMMEEIDAATRDGKLSAIPKYDEVLENCPYYVACVKETLRVCPPGPNIFPRVVGKGGMTLGEKYVPEGCEVTSNPWLVHRDENLYGPDVMEFKPERWLNKERSAIYDKYHMTFGWGARICLGKDFSMLELYKSPLVFFRNFIPEFENKTNPGEFVIKGGVGFWQNMWMTVRSREPVASQQ